MENKLVEKPPFLDNLPEVFIFYVDRNASFFQNRSMKMFNWTDKMDSLIAEIPIPDDLILCDSCNSRIETEKIPLMIELTEDPEIQLVRQALCQNCIEKYYPDLICIGKPNIDLEGIQNGR